MHHRSLLHVSYVALVAISFVCVRGTAQAQIVNPADKQRPPASELDLQPSDVSSTLVTAPRVQVSELREEDRVGPYGQPDWTRYRRFPTTRVYVQPPGHVGVEWWMRPTLPRHGPAEIQNLYEIEFGLPGRFQFDIYLVRDQLGNEGPASVGEQKIELRWALADWDEIPLNPTLYFEVTNKDSAPDAVELKLLLGGELETAWHWGANLVFEHETGGELTNEHEVTLGVSHTLADESYSLGGELKAALINTHADRSEFEEELLVGPSFQYRPTPKIHMDLAALAGIGHDSPDAQFFFVIGYDF